VKTKKRFDAVAFMRKARERIEKEWAEKPRSEEIEYFKKVRPGMKRRRRARPITREQRSVIHVSYPTPLPLATHEFAGTAGYSRLTLPRP